MLPHYCHMKGCNSKVLTLTVGALESRIEMQNLNRNNRPSGSTKVEGIELMLFHAGKNEKEENLPGKVWSVVVVVVVGKTPTTGVCKSFAHVSAVSMRP